MSVRMQGTESDFPEARHLTSSVLFHYDIHSGGKTDESPAANPLIFTWISLGFGTNNNVRNCKEREKGD